jgi:general secretion pathway protein K
LREDARQSGKVDYLGEPWAVKLEDTRLDQYVENGKQDTEASEASLSGQIVDAQSMYNLNNLATDGIPDAREIAVYTKLLSNLRMPSELAKRLQT